MQRWLTRGGTAAALAVGGAVTWGAGGAGLALLVVFFLSSSLLTRGGGRRRAAQVLANGGVAAAAALASRVHPAWTAAFAGALAAATADTWATEIGARSHRTPRLLTTGRPVAPGTSGGVTWLGSAGGAAGAAFIGAAAALLGLLPVPAAPGIAAAGIAGGLADSLLGAALQARWRCEVCGRASEHRRVCCGRPMARDSGVRWLNNDTVNVAATVVGAAAAVLFAASGVASLP